MAASTSFFTAKKISERLSQAFKRSTLAPGKVAYRTHTNPRTFRDYWDGERLIPANKLLEIMALSQEVADEINQIVEEMRNGINPN